MKKNYMSKILIFSIVGVFFLTVMQIPTKAMSYHETVLNSVKEVVGEIYTGTGTKANYLDQRENGTLDFASAVYEEYQSGDYQAILNYIQDNGVQFSKPTSKEIIKKQNEMMNSLYNQIATPFASQEAEVKMFYPDSEVIAFPKNINGTSITFKGYFYTFARFNFVTKKVVWGDRPYTDFATDTIWPGVMSNGSGGGDKSYSGSSYTIKDSYLYIRCKWDGGPVTSDFGPIYYAKMKSVTFYPYTWWDGSGVINRVNVDE